MTHQQLQTIDADTLLSTTLPPTRFIIDRLLPQGLHILAGTEGGQIVAGSVAVPASGAGNKRVGLPDP